MNHSARKDPSCGECNETLDDSRLGYSQAHLAVALSGIVLAFWLGWAAPIRASDKEPFPTMKVVKPTGSLVIVGGGILPDPIRNRFLELAGGANARVVVIPTASRKAEVGPLEALNSYADWIPLVKAGKVKSLLFLHARRSGQANDPAFVKPLTEASGVWFTGGDQSLLMAAYKGTAVEREVKNLLARGGVVGGTSAGAAVMSDLMIRYGNPVAEVGTGFGFFPGVVVDQHFFERNRQARLLGVLAKHPRYLGIGIDEQTGIIVQGQCLTVMGKRNVRVCLPAPDAMKSQVKVMPSGSRIDLADLYRLLPHPVKVSAPAPLLVGPTATAGVKVH